MIEDDNGDGQNLSTVLKEVPPILSLTRLVLFIVDDDSTFESSISTVSQNNFSDTKLYFDDSLSGDRCSSVSKTSDVSCKRLFLVSRDIKSPFWQ